jgi:regulator of sirC expression with transglutaminase-like and TPR domain
MESPAPSSREQFGALLARPDEEIDLAAAALLIAREEYPDLDVARYVKRLDSLAGELAGRVARSGLQQVAAGLAQFLATEHGFRGNTSDYYDPRNSFLNEVLDRRTGIPISLSAVYIEVARRAGLRAGGVGLPGHFLVRLADAEASLLVDPFHGGSIVSPGDCQERLDRIYEGRVKLEPGMLEPLGRRAMLERMLRNLKAIYVKKEEHERALGIVELVLLADPQAVHELRDRGLIYEALECYGYAARDLRAYLERQPAVADMREIRNKIEALEQQASRLH